MTCVSGVVYEQNDDALSRCRRSNRLGESQIELWVQSLHRRRDIIRRQRGVDYGFRRRWNPRSIRVFAKASQRVRLIQVIQIVEG